MNCPWVVATCLKKIVTCKREIYAPINPRKKKENSATLGSCSGDKFRSGLSSGGGGITSSGGYFNDTVVNAVVSGKETKLLKKTASLLQVMWRGSKSNAVHGSGIRPR